VPNYEHFVSTKVPALTCRIMQGKCTCPEWWKIFQKVVKGNARLVLPENFPHIEGDASLPYIPALPERGRSSNG
jgi:hypothetical protein